MSIFDDIQIAMMEMEESRRVVVCAVEDKLLCEEALGDNPLVTIQVSPLMCAGTVVVIDPNSMEASFRESLQHWRPTMF